MGVFTIQYQTIIKPQIDIAVEDALRNEVSKAAVSALEDSAQHRIYDAWTPVIDTRRFSFIDDNTYVCDANKNILTITAVSSFQGVQTGDDLGDVIEKGLSNYRMPFPRPWMEEGINDKISEIENALAIGMQRQGF